MCLGLVMKVEKIIEKEAICEYFGNKRKIRIDVLKDVEIGEYILVHAGFGIGKLTKEEGEERLQSLSELNEKIGELKNGQKNY